MQSHNKQKIRLIPNADMSKSANSPPITRRPGSSTGAESTLGRIEVAKKMPASDMSIIEQQTKWENAQLWNELKYQRRKHGASMYLLEQVGLVVEELQEALVNFQKLSTELEKGIEEEIENE